MNGGNMSERLTAKQETVLGLLLAGNTQVEAAKAAGAAEATVSRWMHGNALFVATLNQRRQDVWDTRAERLRDLVPLAIDIIEAAMQPEKPEGMRVRAALAILKTQGLATGGRPRGETDADKLETSMIASRGIGQLHRDLAERLGR